MSLRSLSTSARQISRRLATAAGQSVESSTKGPKLPVGNDPGAFHSQEHAIKDTIRWRMISAVFAVPVAGFCVIQLMQPHEHVEPPLEYPYLKMATRSPRFPWGEDDLIGTSYERHAQEHGEEH